MQKLSITKDMTQDQIKFQVIRVVSALEIGKIGTCMEALDWTWGWGQDVPTNQELFEAAVERGMEAVNHTIDNGKQSKMSSGGFTAQAQMFEDSEIGLSIWFEITESDNYL